MLLVANRGDAYKLHHNQLLNQQDIVRIPRETGKVKVKSAFHNEANFFDNTIFIPLSLSYLIPVLVHVSIHVFWTIVYDLRM